MSAENDAGRENVLLDQAIAWLDQNLPKSWKVTRSVTHFASPTRASRQLDAAIDIEIQNMRTTLIAELKPSFTPRDADRFSDSMVKALRTLNPNAHILVVSDWLSPQTRELLRGQDINYLDLTGNVDIEIESPQIFVRTEGSSRDPRPRSKGRVRLRGPGAARLLRFLVDVRPPYGVREIAGATGLAQSYVSRLLESLDQEALITRRERGRVASVAIANLLRRWSESYDLFGTNESQAFISTRGPKWMLKKLAEPRQERVVVTGSYAAVRLAPVAAPALFVGYCDDPGAFALWNELLPTEHGADIVLLQPNSLAALEGTTIENGVEYAAVSQVAVDCLSGNGRMPAEGDALITWMLQNEDAWRTESLDAFVAGVR